jgi:hypothetical protein
MGMEAEKAASRVAEFGEGRWDEALQALNYVAKPVRRPLGWVMDYVFKNRAAPKRLVDARAASAQTSMIILSQVASQAPDPWSELAVETSRQEVAEARQAIIDQVAIGNDIASPVAWARARIYGEREKAELMPTGTARSSRLKPTAEEIADMRASSLAAQAEEAERLQAKRVTWAEEAAAETQRLIVKGVLCGRPSMESDERVRAVP